MLTRRRALSTLAAGIGGVSASGWFPTFAAEQQAAVKKESRHVILLWMSGGPSQMDTWDLKPGHANGGEFKEIETASPGLKFSEHLPKLAAMSDKLAVLRGLSTNEGDHGRGTYLMRTGHTPMGALQYPSIGASLANSLSEFTPGLPDFVSVGPYRALNQDAFGAGFLGPRYSPLIVGASDLPGGVTTGASGFPELKVQGMSRSEAVTEDRMNRRLQMWKGLQSEFLASHSGGAVRTHNMIYEGAVQLMNSKDALAFDLTKEPDEVRTRYGQTVFGQGCLLARRLIEHGVSFVEVSLGTSSGGIGWDTHSDIFTEVARLSADLDTGWSALMTDLNERGLLDSTTILWMGEFGRTPAINPSVGRDHFPNAWSAVLAGGGIAGGQAFGRTSDDGMEVVDGMISAEDLLSTLCHAAGVGGVNLRAPDGRPIPITSGEPIREVLA
ncbi:MAG: DUF1501 domain-containing protein [Planctomycetaceae bacterium]